MALEINSTPIYSINYNNGTDIKYLYLNDSPWWAKRCNLSFEDSLSTYNGDYIPSSYLTRIQNFDPSSPIGGVDSSTTYCRCGDVFTTNFISYDGTLLLPSGQYTVDGDLTVKCNRMMLTLPSMSVIKNTIDPISSNKCISVEFSTNSDAYKMLEMYEHPDDEDIFSRHFKYYIQALTSYHGTSYPIASNVRIYNGTGNYNIPYRTDITGGQISAWDMDNSICIWSTDTSASILVKVTCVLQVGSRYAYVSSPVVWMSNGVVAQVSSDMATKFNAVATNIFNTDTYKDKKCIN